MIVVKIELWPRGNQANFREIGRMYIANDATSTNSRRGNYDVAVCRREWYMDKVPAPLAPFGPAAARVGRVEKYPRLSYNVWRLIARCLLSAFPEEARKLPVVHSLEEAEPADKDSLEASHEAARELTQETEALGFYNAPDDETIATVEEVVTVRDVRLEDL